MTTPRVTVPVEPLWMMHVIGPDDIYPAPDHDTAVEWCAYLNREIAPKAPSVLCVAVPAIWTGTAEEHAEGLPEAIKGWSVPSAAPAPEGRTVPFDREGLIALIMEETTDDIVADGWDRLGKPNVLVQGCRYIRRNAPPSPEGYANPEASAKQFAGFIADRILAALSPEAPARERVPEDVRRLVIAARNVAFESPTQSELRALDIASEAFASQVPWDDEPGTPSPPRHEAPAEGAGELWSVGSWLSAALDDPSVCAEMKADIREWFDNGGHLRARSSAPEAREGEVVAWRYRPSSAATAPFPPPSVWNYHEDNPSDSLASYYEIQPLYTHPAPDALRVAVEALERAREDLFNKADKDEMPEQWSSVQSIDQALAALQAETKPPLSPPPPPPPSRG